MYMSRLKQVLFQLTIKKTVARLFIAFCYQTYLLDTKYEVLGKYDKQSENIVNICNFELFFFV